MEDIKRYFGGMFSEDSFQSLMYSVKWFALICSITGFSIGIKIYTNTAYSPKDYTKKFDAIYVNIDIANKKDTPLDAKTLFDLKHKHYLGVSNNLRNIQKGMVIILIISFMILIFGAREIPFFGLTIPDTLIYIVVYFGGLYLFANFGLTLNSLIENRLSLHSYVDYLENASGGIYYSNSIGNLLSDASFGDNWFSHYFDIYQGRNPNGKTNYSATIISWLGLYGFHASIIGGFLGAILTTSIEFLRRKSLKLKYAYLMILFMIVIFVLCAVSFTAKFIYPVFWVSSIALVITFWLFLWHKHGERIYKKFNLPKSQRKISSLY